MEDSLNREIEDFRKAPENVHFEALKQDIAQLFAERDRRHPARGLA